VLIDQDGDGRPDWNRISNHVGVAPIVGAGMVRSRSWVGPAATDPGFPVDNWLVTPRIEIPEGTSALTLQYYKCGNDGSQGIFLDYLEVLISTTGIATGLTPNTLGPIGTPGTVIGDWTVVSRSRTTGDWEQNTINLSNFADAEHIYLALRHRDEDKDYVLVDELQLFVGALPTFGIISGVVTNVTNGEPLAGVVVNVVDSNITTNTDARGAFFLQVPESTVRITATRDGFTPFTSGNLNVVAGRQVVHNISLGAPGSITGTVRRESNYAPLGGVLVRVAEGLQATTNSAGVYTINNIPAGVVRVSGTMAGFVPYNSGNLTVVAAQQLTHDFVMGAVDEDDVVAIPLVTALQGNFPNPFNPSTTIKFSLSSGEVSNNSLSSGEVSNNSLSSGEGRGEGSTNVNITVYNIRGQVVKTLVNDYFPAGRHSVEWNGTDNRGRTVSSGIYFYRMTAGEYSATKRMVLMK